jgi:hypothetical protein
MDSTNTLWLDAVINDLNRKTRHRRSDPEGDRDGYSDDVLQMLGLNQEARDDFRREQRLAKACYEI